MSKIFVCGDIFNGNSCDNFISKEVIDIIKKCELAIFNLEGPIVSKSNSVLKAGPILKQHPSTINTLKKSGFNLALLSNNHIFDYGKEGLEQTILSLDNNDIQFIGAGRNYNEIFSPLVKEIAGFKIGFINACEFHNGAYDQNLEKSDSGYLWLNHPDFDEMIKKTRSNVDILFVFVHAGLENVNIPLWEWRQKYKSICDLGADYVIGSHPHVPQGIEDYNNSTIFYSLGNFYFDYHKSTNETYSLVFDLYNLKNVSFVYTSNIGEKVVLSEKNIKSSVEILNNKIRLLTNKYDVQSIAPEISKKIMIDYLSAFLSIDSRLNLFFIIKIIFLRFLVSKSKSRYLNTLRYHFFRNETYQMVMENLYRNRIK
jgi:poly-gamma-glutamate synthesis protein (capsule biosynthesis protein)